MLFDTDANLRRKAQYPELPGTEIPLGCFCREDRTVFRLWSPLARAVTLCLYPDGDRSPMQEAVPMTKDDSGVWSAEFPRSLHGTYYLYRMDHGTCVRDAGDPYAFACGCNSRRCMAVDLRKTDPPGWEEDRAPALPPENIIYELHVKEFSWQKSAGFPEEYRGKYLAFTCPDTCLNGDPEKPTGLAYLKKLGPTHVQLMPVYDFGSVDDLREDGFNWGYDPLYYNVPEGSYSTDPRHGEVRIRELKALVQALHRAGLRVVMDVVYNHTYSLNSPFNQVVPWYYYRTDAKGTPSSGSGCGNDFASEMPMAGKFILDSVLYWAEEYHMDGFRFDLMGLLDVGLMNRIRGALDEKYGVGEKLLYGEPWAAGPTEMQPGFLPAGKANIHLLDSRIGMFSDDIRDSIRGHVFDLERLGFATGGKNLEQEILRSVRGRCCPGSNVKAPSQILSYISAHDNHTLWDRLGHSCPSPLERMKRNRLAAGICMTCQGNLFLLSGEEFARTKEGLDNTYNGSIALNRLDWERAWEFSDLREYYRGLMGLRKLCPGLCDKSPSANMRIRNARTAPGLVDFTLDNGGRWKQLRIIYNGTRRAVPVDSGWLLLADGKSSSCWEEGGRVFGGKAMGLSVTILGSTEA